MSIGNLGWVGSIAAATTAQAKAADVDKAKHDTAASQVRDQSAERSQEAAGIGRTHEDAQSQDRDADGRRPWEIPLHEKNAPGDSEALPPRSKDPSRQTGEQIDFSA
jgi:hypothetical protein